MAAQLTPITRRSVQINGKISLKALARLIELSKLKHPQVLVIDFNGSADVAEKDHLTFDHFGKAWVIVEVQINIDGPLQLEQVSNGVIKFDSVLFH